MVYFVGSTWSWIFGVIGFLALVAGAIWFFVALSRGNPIVGGIALFVFGGMLLFWLATFAGTHFRVPINERALLINTIDQKVIGVEESGIGKKPLLGVKVKQWPANTQYQISVNMSNGTDSATTKNGTSVYDDVTIYVDLSEMDIAAAYKAVNGDWDTFLEKNLLKGLKAISRSVSIDYSTNDHTLMRSNWELQFEDEVVNYLSDPNKGFGIKLIRGRTVLSWDFVNIKDAEAYDEANQAAYEITKRQNEKAALLIEAEMVEIRNQMTEETTGATVENMNKISLYLQSQPKELWPYLIDYLSSMENMEYLRIVGSGDYDVIIPPNGSAIISMDGQQPGVTSAPSPTETPAK